MVPDATKTRGELYPISADEWVLFVEPRIDQEADRFLDGVVDYHGKDQQEAYRRTGKVKGHRAMYYTGVIPYRTVTFIDDENGEQVA